MESEYFPPIFQTPSVVLPHNVRHHTTTGSYYNMGLKAPVEPSANFWTGYRPADSLQYLVDESAYPASKKPKNH